MRHLPIEIDDPSDPRVAMFRDIRERDLVGRGGLIAEGAVVLDQLLSSRRFRATALLVLRSRLAGLAARLERLPDGVPVYVAGQGVFDALAGFAVHRGVLAHAERTAEAVADPQALARQGALVVAAVGISNHDNIGAIFRNATAFGASAVFLDETACDPLYRKAIRVSVGATLTLPFARLGQAREMATALAEAGFGCAGLSPGGAIAVGDWRPDGPTALFLGPEGPGLPDEILRRMTGVRIDMAAGFDSLNVATAAAVALYCAGAWRARPRRGQA